RGRSREPPAASRVGIIHDERNMRGVLQQAEAAPLQRCLRPFMAPLFTFHLSLFTFHTRPARDPFKMRGTPNARFS
ncbi:MAG: hypothetical protein WAM44_13485, partial [Chthoniobacterales bacterium]